MKYRLQSMHNHMVGRTTSVISPFYSLLPVVLSLFQVIHHLNGTLETLNLSENREDCFFIARKVFNSDNYTSFRSMECAMQIPFVAKPHMKMVSFQKQKHGYQFVVSWPRRLGNV